MSNDKNNTMMIMHPDKARIFICQFNERFTRQMQILSASFLWLFDKIVFKIFSESAIQTDTIN